MSLEKAHERALLWLRQAEDDWFAAQLLQQGGQATQACFLAQQVGEKVIKALLAEEDRDLRSHSLGALLRFLGAEHHERWQREAPVDVFGAEDALAALGAAERLLTWVRSTLGEPR